MNRTAFLFTAVLVAISQSSSLPIAQGQVEFVERMNREFLTRKPVVGDQVENVEVFDEEGKRFSFNSSRGKHTVLIFGCLT